MHASVFYQEQSFAWEGSYPHVSDCWRLTILKHVLSIVFLLSAVFELGAPANHKPIPWGGIVVTRIMLSSLLCFIHAFQLLATIVAAVSQAEELPILSLLTPFSLTLSDAVVILVLIRAVQKGFFRTGVVWTYVLTAALTSLLNSYLLASIKQIVDTITSAFNFTTKYGIT